MAKNDKLHRVLFEEGRDLVNLKFLLGSDDKIDEQELRDSAADAIIDALEKGPIHNPPVSGIKKGILA